jgi:polar amino acid transport system ATP-binding protein
MAKLKIDITDLHKSFGSNEVLKGITTRFNEGDVVCIIGPSGSGKSTFLRTLNGLEEITSGTVIVDGYDLTNTKTNLNQVRQEVGMVFQQFNLFPNMTVLENITYAPLELKKMSKDEAHTKALICLKKLGCLIKLMPCLRAYLVVRNNVLRLPAHWRWILT